MLINPLICLWVLTSNVTSSGLTESQVTIRLRVLPGKFHGRFLRYFSSFKIKSFRSLARRDTKYIPRSVSTVSPKSGFAEFFTPLTFFGFLQHFGGFGPDLVTMWPFCVIQWPLVTINFRLETRRDHNQKVIWLHSEGRPTRDRVSTHKNTACFSTVELFRIPSVPRGKTD